MRLFRGFAVAAFAWRNRIAVRAGLRMAKEATDTLIEFWADDVLEFASLVVQFGVFDGERVLEKSLGQPVAPDNVAGATAAARRQLHGSILQFDQLQIRHSAEHSLGRLIRQDRKIARRSRGAKNFYKGRLSFFATDPDLLEQVIEANFVIGRDVAATIGGIDQRASQRVSGAVLQGIEM
jgi:hypothetical protein